MRSLILVLLFLLTHAGLCGAQTLRSDRPSFKGVELYSWLDAPTKTWRFALVPGTNRIKSPEEILGNPEVASSVQELLHKLRQLTPFESVYWLVPESGSFSIPPQDVIDTIKQSAATNHISITVLDGGV